MVDLTGGYGVDTYFLNGSFSAIDYVEQNAELCRIAEHNFADRPIAIHNSSAEEFLQTAGQYDLIFLDPARRDSHGGKVFRLEDCTPNVVELLPTLLAHGKQLMIKLSPMLDLTQALSRLSTLDSQLTWDVYVVAIKNEVKEVLLLSRPLISNPLNSNPLITAIDLTKKDQAFVFTKEEESNSEAVLQQSGQEKHPLFLYEPNAAILKAGAYKLVAQRFGLTKLDVNTHLYVSDVLVPNFPGRVWQIQSQMTNGKWAMGNGKCQMTNANVLVRNYPLTPEQLKKKLHLRDGGTAFVIGCRVAGKPTLFYATRV